MNIKTKSIRIFQIVFCTLYFLHCTYSFSQGINGGGLHSLSLCSDSTVMAWGYNINGQLGVGDTLDRHSPVRVHGPGNVGVLTGITALASGGNPLAGVSHSLALKSDGTVWAWGWNHYSQLGDGDTISRTTPVQVSNLTGIIAIAGGGYHSYALKNDGTVWAWGRNYRGQLGTGDTISSNIPVQVHGPGNVGFLTGITAIAGGGWGHSYALKNDGTVWSWGQNFYGQLGLGDTTDRHFPVQVNLSGIIAISGGGGHSLALKNDGTVWAWGYNSLDQLGDSTSTDSHIPVKVSLLTGISAIAGGAAHCLALKNDGTVWAWGFNQFGQLGDGTTTNGIVPLMVSSLSGISAISGGGGHCIARKNDGTVWAWGYNAYGQLGDGSTIQRSAPVQVNGLCQVTGIDEFLQQGSIRVYPNPTNGKTNVTIDQFEKLKMKEIEIYNMYGAKIYSNEAINFQINSSANFQIDLSSQPAGIYFIKIISEGNTIGTEKIVVE